MNRMSLRPRQLLTGSLRAGLLAMSGLLLAGLTPTRGTAAAPVKIGIIGAGKMGGELAELWAKAGHEIMISSRHPDDLKAQAHAIGPNVHVGT
ncbi:MAG TPA: NAD(P)-binding domain-containing protein, partial [Gammaproteobacteria bacterium]|nr:NAD(P)-binding domain-containing protein [Gammaproteobacteria bacterium]